MQLGGGHEPELKMSGWVCPVLQSAGWGQAQSSEMSCAVSLAPSSVSSLWQTLQRACEPNTCPFSIAPLPLLHSGV